MGGPVQRAFGKPWPAPRLAQHGDVVQADADLGEALGIVLGNKIVAAGPDGLQLLPTTMVKVAWAI